MEMASKTLPDAEKRQEYLENHFVYEVRELNATVWYMMSLQRYSGGRRPDLLQYLGNAGLDHFLLHGRNLLEFYYKTNKPHLYARANAYAPNWRPPTKTAAVRKLHDRVNDEITHLGWKRLDVKDDEKGWPYVDIAIDMCGITETFLKVLDKRYHTTPVRLLRAENIEFQKMFYQMKATKTQVFPDMFDLIGKETPLANTGKGRPGDS
jgi:hypothetical protein